MSAVSSHVHFYSVQTQDNLEICFKAVLAFDTGMEWSNIFQTVPPPSISGDWTSHTLGKQSTTRLYLVPTPLFPSFFTPFQFLFKKNK